MDGSGHVSSMWLNIPSISADICSNPFIVPSGANSRSISGSFSDTVPYTSRGSSDQIVALDAILDDTAEELDRLKQEVFKFGSTLENADTTIESSVGSITSSVGNIEEASIQLNSLLFPVVASIGIIVALQIAILARRR